MSQELTQGLTTEHLTTEVSPEGAAPDGVESTKQDLTAEAEEIEQED